MKKEIREALRIFYESLSVADDQIAKSNNHIRKAKALAVELNESLNNK